MIILIFINFFQLTQSSNCLRGIERKHSVSSINAVNMNKYLLFHFFGKVNFNIINALSLNNNDNLSINDRNTHFQF